MWLYSLIHIVAKLCRMTINRNPMASSAREVYRAIDALDTSVDFDPALRELVRLRKNEPERATG